MSNQSCNTPYLDCFLLALPSSLLATAYWPEAKAGRFLKLWSPIGPYSPRDMVVWPWAHVAGPAGIKSSLQADPKLEGGGISKSAWDALALFQSAEST